MNGILGGKYRTLKNRSSLFFITEEKKHLIQCSLRTRDEEICNFLHKHAESNAA